MTRQKSEVGMVIKPTEKQKEVLGSDSNENLVVLGRPGCGKTTVALLKALHYLEPGRHLEFQKVLFLSFSRSAVRRLTEASYALKIPRESRRHLEIQTFHAFFWEIIRSHSPLVGIEKPVSFLRPEEQRILRSELGGADDPRYQEALVRLESEESRIIFDRFAKLAFEVLQGQPVLQKAYAKAFPLILADEYQDTTKEQDQAIRLLVDGGSQLICLGDPEQSIYGYQASVSKKRLSDLQEQHGFREVELERLNHRSGETQILDFARGVLKERPVKVTEVEVVMCGRRNIHCFKKIRECVGRIRGEAKAGKFGLPRWPSIGVMVPRNDLARELSSWLRAPDSGNPVRHTTIFDSEEIGGIEELVFTILEGRLPEDSGQGALVERILDSFSRRELCRRRIAQGRIDKFSEATQRIQSGDAVKRGWLKQLSVWLGELQWSGHIAKDLDSLSSFLEALPKSVFLQDGGIRYCVDEVLADRMWRRELEETFEADGRYTGAVELARRRRSQKAILGGPGERERSVVVMTLHKAKGREFDAVVIAEPMQESSRIVRRHEIGKSSQPDSRQLLHMAITRARRRVYIVTPAGAMRCELLPR